jgi:Sap-like sulfolipid-1-addressing protein
VGWVYAELAAISLAAMVSPTTLSFSIFVLVVGDRPLRTGSWFYLGALGATLAIGIVAAFVIGDVAASHKSTPKTWVAVVDVVAAALIVIFVLRLTRRPPDPQRVASTIEQMAKVAASPAIAIVGAGAALANPGGFIPLALKAISETDPSAYEYIVEWVVFALVSLLPLAVALVLLIVARDRALRLLAVVRAFIERRARTVAVVILLLLAAALLRNGIAGLTA